MFKKLDFRKFLFGTKYNVNNTDIEKSKTITFSYSTGNNQYSNKSITFRSDDGFIQYLLERIESIETELNEIKKSKKNK